MSLYEVALSELETQFGNPTAVVQSTLSSILQHPVVKHNDIAGLTSLSRALHTAVCVLKSMGYQADLAATSSMQQVIAKLPSTLAWQWGQLEVEMMPHVPTLEDIDSWLGKVVLAGRRVQPALCSKVQDSVARSAHTPAPLNRRRGDTRGNTSSAQRTTLATASGAAVSAECVVCQSGAHALAECPSFLEKTPEERGHIVRSGRRCFRCLSTGHWLSKCSSRTVCGERGCKGRHHRLLHIPSAQSPHPAQTRPTATADARDVMAMTQTETHTSQRTLLQLVPIRIHGTEGRYKDTLALLDSGADTSLCEEHVLKELGIDGDRRELQLANVEGSGDNRLAIRTSLQVSSLSPGSNAKTVTVPEVFSVVRLNVRPQSVDWKQRKAWKHLDDIVIPDNNGKAVELLLGANVLEAMLQQEVRVGKPGQPVAVRTHFGWCLTGNVAQLVTHGQREVMHISKHRSADDELVTMLKDWWSTEAFGTAYNMKEPTSQEDRRAEDIMARTTTWRGDRYETGLLWCDENVKLPDNYPMAMRRLENTERTLRRAPEKATAYQQSMEENVKKGYARKLDDEELLVQHDRTWYLPHHAVTSKPGKFRVVFDAASSYGGSSLNGHLLSGPDLLRSLPGVLLRFRLGSVGLCADIEKMFMQVAVRAEDQASLRYLWRDLDSTRPPDIYQMDRVIFGARSSPASASYVLRRTAQEKSDDTVAGRRAREIVERDFYMDDLATSEPDNDTAQETAAEVTALLSRGGFRLCKWNSNSREVLARISMEDRAAGAVDLNASLPTQKVLGVQWDAELDELSPSAPTVTNVGPTTPTTKREILRVIAGIFDPLGLASPFLVMGKMILQTLVD
ncbi:uncharacterized protein LOC122367319 [Amphibalanus amphitrite]|uniref:uncharacterized protein LOC122367319 n=1 Tax=Amphibalanus amphitrite TaxID=1232801 RepID=UPI001C919A29|nr:uncharacterized protein LOC122367319 [Amphibalanus amphitrite]